MVRRFEGWLVVLACIVAVVTGPAAGQDIDLPRPAEGVFIVDDANLLDDDDETLVRDAARALLDDTGVPLIVVTIDRMRDHWSYGTIRIETFAHVLFDQWGIGSVTDDPASSNKGILLVVAKGDRKARIQLGGGWGRRHDAQAERIMQQQIISRFKRGKFDEGVVAGVGALDDMARAGNAADATSVGAGSRSAAPPATRSPVRPPSIPHHMRMPRGPSVISILAKMLGCGVVFIIVVTIASIFVRRSVRRVHGHTSSLSGRALGTSHGGGFWSGFLMGNLLNSSRHGGGGNDDDDSWFSGGSSGLGGFSSSGFGSGGFSGGGGGSFGGGFSGGGGASGGW